MSAVPWSDLALGATVVLALGAVASAAIRGPHDRHRAGAATVVALLCWLGLALAPLPRVDLAGGVSVIAPREPRSSLPVRSAVQPPAVLGEAPAAIEPLAVRITAARAGAPADSRIDFADLVHWLWIAGSLGSCVLLSFGHVALRRVLRRADPAPELTELARTLDAPGRAPAIVVISDDASRPFCCGVLRPTVVVPRALSAPHRRAGLVHVLRHELAHVRHGDLLVQAVFGVALVPFWWHPLLWWLRARTRFAAELVADEVAAAAAADRRTYARDLVEVAALAPHGARFRVPTLSVFERESDFSRRMKMLLARHESLTVHSRRPMRIARAALVLLVVAGTAGVFGRTALTAQEPPRPSEPASTSPAAPEAAVDRLQAENRALRAQVRALEARLDAGPAAPATGHDLAAIADLATRAIDARAELRMAESALARLRPLFERRVVDRTEVEVAEVRAQVARDKLEVLRMLIASELDALAIDLEATKAELEVLRDREPHSAMVERESRIRRLSGYVRVLESAR